MAIGLLSMRPPRFGKGRCGGPARRRFRPGGIMAGVGLYLTTLIAGPAVASAANPAIKGVTFTGTNADIHVAIAGSGFGIAPKGVPCRGCKTRYLHIATARNGCQLFNIASWTDTNIVFDGLQGNPGDSVLVAVTNPQTQLIGILGRLIIPSTILPDKINIASVSFSGAINRDLEITVTGSGFGASPPGFPFSGYLPYFVFVDRPFQPTQWMAGYSLNAVYLNYGLWTNNRIVIIGFGGMYGSHDWVIKPNDPVEIAVANTKSCGLNVNPINLNMNPLSNVLFPGAIGAVWGGHLR